ncbi:MAG: amidase [Chloroflexi bacterium]|nr:amidase [Chloroflexota bacterium]
MPQIYHWRDTLLQASGTIRDIKGRSTQMNDLIYESVSNIATEIKQKKVSCLEVTEMHLKRIEAVNPVLNAVVQICSERAIAEAKAADKKIANQEKIGPLHGVPMTLKDSLDTKEVISTGGTKGRVSFIPENDATVTSRLRNAGAILLGKTNTPEFTLAGETDNLVYGRTNNPYDPTRIPGGSSGGAAAIIASGGSPLDIGSDTGGSIRMPSHFCGITGIKPNSGRIPRTGHIVNHTMGAFDSLTQNGPMARYVEDLILTLPILCGPDWVDPAIIGMPLRDPYKVRVQNLRVAFYTDNGIHQPSQEIQNTVRSAAKALENIGLTVEEARPKALQMTPEINNSLNGGDGRAWVKRLVDSANTTEISPFLQKRLSSASPISTAEFTANLEMLDKYRSDMLFFMKDYDAIISPTAPFTACGHGETFSDKNRNAFAYTQAYNMTGWPGTVVRYGETEDNLPIGVQIVSRPWREDVSLAVALELEKISGGWKRPNI